MSQFILVKSQIEHLEQIIEKTKFHLDSRAGNPYINLRRPYNSSDYINWNNSSLKYLKKEGIINDEELNLLYSFLTDPNEDDFSYVLKILENKKAKLIETKTLLEEKLLKNQYSDIHLGQKQASHLDSILKYFVNYSKGIKQYYLNLKNVSIDTNLSLSQIKDYIIKLYKDGYLDLDENDCAALKQKGLDFVEDVDEYELWGYSKNLYFENQKLKNNSKVMKNEETQTNQITPTLKAKIVDNFLQKIKDISTPKRIAEIIEKSPRASKENKDLFRLLEFEIEELSLVKLIGAEIIQL
jgi:hypothetical protein